MKVTLNVFLVFAVCFMAVFVAAIATQADLATDSPTVFEQSYSGHFDLLAPSPAKDAFLDYQPVEAKELLAITDKAVENISSPLDYTQLGYSVRSTSGIKHSCSLSIDSMPLEYSDLGYSKWLSSSSKYNFTPLVCPDLGRTKWHLNRFV